MTFIGNLHSHLSQINELKYTSLIKMIILEENFKWHLEAFASELFVSIHVRFYKLSDFKVIYLFALKGKILH